MFKYNINDEIKTNLPEPAFIVLFTPDLQSDKVLTVKDAINGFMQKEIIEDYVCPKTKLKVIIIINYFYYYTHC